MGEVIGDDFDVAFDEVGDVEVIASGRGVCDHDRLSRDYAPGRWRKLKGWARASHLRTGETCEVEVHWYQAHGVGKVEKKIVNVRRV